MELEIMQIVLGYWPFRQPTVSVTAGGNFQWNFPPHQRWMRLHLDDFYVFDTNPWDCRWMSVRGFESNPNLTANVTKRALAHSVCKHRTPYYSHSLHTECQCKLPIWGPIPAPRVLHFQTPRKQCKAAPRCRGTQWIKTKGPSNVAMVRQLACA